VSYPRPALYGTLYRWLMKLAHRYNWHHTRTYYQDGDTFVRCDWCGLSKVMQRRDYKPVILGETLAKSASRTQHGIPNG